MVVFLALRWRNCRFPSLFSVVVFALGALSLGAATSEAQDVLRSSLGAAAEQDPVEVTHVVFPENIGHKLGAQGGRLPVYLELQCRGARPETVTVDAKVCADGGGRPLTTRSRFEVAPGVPRRVWIYICAEPHEESQVATIEVKTRGRTIRQGDRWILSSYDDEISNVVQPAMLVVGGEEAEPPLWRQNLELRETEVSSEASHWLKPHQLPDSVLGYHSFDVVILRGFEAIAAGTELSRTSHQIPTAGRKRRCGLRLCSQFDPQRARSTLAVESLRTRFFNGRPGLRYVANNRSERSFRRPIRSQIQT